MSIETGFLTTPIGIIRITGDRDALHTLYFVEEKPTELTQPESLLPYLAQIQEYFTGSRQEFTIPLESSGTPFHKRVWEKLRTIPYGTTVSYGELAMQIGNPSASRAVGTANGSNPISIIVPCHRVIGANGKLVGYGGGLWRKQWLLSFEQEHSTSSLFHS
ncbi:MAG: methylated-DNA--[protein]-cysteine S-methyltransferase [bacterium]|nr:methylated-DNA--[protein]-cysteine S-methyltransferase [bacterium]